MARGLGNDLKIPVRSGDTKRCIREEEKASKITYKATCKQVQIDTKQTEYTNAEEKQKKGGSELSEIC